MNIYPILAMKTLHSYSQRTQPVSPEALQHIMALADRDNRGVVERSARYYQRAKKRRQSEAAPGVTFHQSQADGIF